MVKLDGTVLNDFREEIKKTAGFKHPEHDTLQYLLIDGTFHGATVGHFRNGPYDLVDVILDLPTEDAAMRKDEILEAVYTANFGQGNPIKRYNGEEL